MTRVVAEATWAKTTYPQLLTQTAGTSLDAPTVRQCINKVAFAELLIGLPMPARTTTSGSRRCT